MKKIQKFALAAGATVATLASLNSCKSREQKAAEAEQARQEQLAEQKQINREFAQAVDAYYVKTRDSLLQVMGYNRAAVERAEQISKSKQEDEYALWDITGRPNFECRGTQQGLMYEQIDTMVNQKCAKYAREIAHTLELYDLFVPSAGYSKEAQIQALKDICVGSLAPFCADSYENLYRFIYNINKPVDQEELERLADATQSFKIFDEKTFNWKEYGESRQNEVITAVNNILLKMYRDICTSTKQIARSFAKYYPVLSDPKDMPAEYAKLLENVELWWEHSESGEWYPGYIAGDVVVKRCVRVYDSKLPVSFFGEEGADYKLVNVAPGKWQVIRTSKDGKVAKTAVFTHNVDYTFVAGVNDEGAKVGDGTFEFAPGANMGVEIIASEVVFIKKREIANDKIPNYAEKYGQEDAKIDSLRMVINRKEDFIKALREKPDSIYTVADRTARDKAKERSEDIRAQIEYRHAQAKANAAKQRRGHRR